MNWKRDALLVSAALGTAAATWLSPTAASACGGFFCNNTQPVNQAAERIIFAHRPNGHVTAVIQIQYSGPSESFSWLLPVQGTPTIGVSSNSAFSLLQNATNPLYQLTTTIEGTCSDPFGGRGGPVASDSSGVRDAGVSGGGGNVSVLDRGSVGPYDYVTISISPDAADQFDEARAWLEDNGYDVPDLGPDTLRPYLEAGMNLLAFRLTKGNDAGSIRPVIIDFGEGAASIPIRPTAVAATDDMGVMVWVAGEKRAIPANYAHLELNEALIDWINPNNNYNNVVTLAANEAGGQGFVTEMAGELDVGELVYPQAARDLWASVRAEDWSDRESELLNTVLGNFGVLDGMRDVVDAEVPVPDGTDRDEFLACPSCYLTTAESDIDGFDPTSFLASVESLVMKPLADTVELFEDAPYVSRLYSTMSAHEMTMDPIFQFNGDLGDVSNTHNANRIIECSPSLSQSEAPWRIELPDGRLVVRGMGQTWPFTTGSGEMPGNARVLRLGESGEGRVVTDNVDRITAALNDHNATVPTASGGGGCQVSFGSRREGVFALALAGLVLAAARRRKRA